MVRTTRVLARTVRTATGGTATTTAAGVTTVRSAAGKLVSRTSRRTIATTTRTPSGGTRTVTTGGLVTERDPTGKLISRTTQPLPTVTRRTETGGTITVTPDGKVTTRDSTGRLIERFQAEPSSARGFILAEDQRLTVLTRELKRIEILRQQPQTKEVKQKIDRLTVTAVKQEKGLAGIRQRLRLAKEKSLVRITKAQFRQPGVKPETALGEGILVLGTLGVLRGVLGVVETIRHPIRTAKQLFQAFRPLNFMATLRGIGQDFTVDPVGAVAEFYTYGKVLNLAGKTVKKSPVGRFVQERLYVRALPKEMRKPVSQFLKSDKVQRKINPGNIPSIKNADFLKVKSLTKAEAKALAKTLRQTDSVIFGSASARITGRRPGVRTKLPLPKDVDLATRSTSTFNKKFMKNLPRQIKRDYKVVGQKIIRISDGRPLLDVKPLSRLIPSRSIFTRRGELPVTGFVRQVKKRPGSILPTIKRKPGVTRLTIPTKKIVKIKGIKLIGFAEQTTRKFLGTLQVLIEKSVRRAKDPQGFLLSLKIQLETLKLRKPTTAIGKALLRRKVKTLSGSIKILQSKSFAKLLEKKVPGITTQFPLLTKIDIKKLKKINIKKANRQAKIRARAKPVPIPKEELRRPKINQVFKEPSKLPIGREILSPSRIPSRLPTRLPKPSIIPIRLPSTRLPRTISKLPRSRIPKSILKAPSKIPSIIPSLIKIPKVPPTKVPVSRVPRVPVSKVPISKLKKIKIAKLKKRRKIIVKKKIKVKLKQQEKRLIKLVEKIPQMRKLIYIPDLYSLIFGIKANLAERKFFLKPGRVFTGIFIRKLVGGK